MDMFSKLMNKLRTKTPVSEKRILDNILLTHNFGKTSPFTIHADTQALLDVTATEKEYSGGYK